jgi:hypothetical protein
LKQLDIAKCQQINAMLMATVLMAVALNWVSLGALKWADFLEHGKGVGADTCQAGQYYKTFVEYRDRMNKYYWDGFGGIVVGDGMTLEVSG